MVLCSVFDVVKKIAEKCVEPIVGYVKTEVGYLCSYKANIEKLRVEVVNMNAETTSMKDRIQAENRSGKTKVDALAETWLTKMACVSDEADRIIKEEERETERCLMGLRPNLWACYQASKSAKKVIDGADERKKEREKIITVAHIDHSQCLGFEINPHFEELESRKKDSEQTVAYLQDPSVKMVGMYGMGGTGKTTLAENIGMQLYEDGTFRYVVKTDVSNNQKTDLTHIQKQIADQLKIRLGDDKDDVKARAKQLREQLEKMDKVLIILDDIWSRFELREVGIPLDRELKLLITSRDLNVMNEMDSKHNVQLGVLSLEDSWKLFDRMAYGVAPDSDTALDVVKQCGGIPVLLVAIARALRNKDDLETWKEALFQLKKFEGDNFVEQGYKRLEVSYNFLPNYELKSLFLLCAQLDHRSIPIDDLLRYSMGLGLYNREKLCDVRSRLHSHLSDLKGYCWLQDGNTEGTVRMHDVVHKFAANIANKDRGISSTVAEAQLQEWPSKDKLEQFSISLPHRHLPPPDHQLPVAFDSSKLESFLLLRSEGVAFLNVPDKFFIGMKELKLVDVRRISLSPVLCSSFSVLVKLRTLCLDNCALDDIAVIGDLRMLQVLSLKGSTVSQIERLGSNLKLLDLRDCGQLKVIASGVFCNLTLLEDLRIGKSFGKWEPLQGCNSGSDHETSTTKKLASLREFKNLGNLINLDIKIPDPKTFPKDLVFTKLERFNVVIGDQYYWEYEIDSLKVRLVGDIQSYEGIKVLMRKAKELHLEEIQGVTSVCGLLGIQNLTSIHVSRCNVLKYLFSSHLALRGLLCLKEISVRYCESMETIVSRVDEEEEIIEFTQLRTLSLIGLGRLISFYSSGNSTPNPIISSSQERQEQDPMSSNQRLPTSLFNKKVVLPKLEELELRWLEVDRILAIEADNCWFQNLTILEVHACYNLSYLFTSSMVRNLAQLKEFEVAWCSSIEEIVATKGEMAGNEEEIIEFTHLRKLRLTVLDRLISFYSSGNSTPNPIISSSQERQEQDPMSSNQRLPTSLFNKKVVLPKLEYLRLWDLKIDRILAIEAERINCCFQNLTFLKVDGCHNLSYLFTSSMVRNLAQLKEFEVAWCSSIEEIVATKGEMAGDEEEIIEFTHLRKLELSGLHRLISFYSSGNSTPNPMSSNQELPTSLFNKKVVLLKLKELRLERLKVDRILAIEAERINCSFQNLTILKVDECHNLSYLFTSSMVRSLAQLQKLEVHFCKTIEEIVATKGEMAGDEEEIIEFTHLRELRLYRLPRLISFYSSGNSTPNPIMSSSQERQEHNYTFLFNKKVAFPNLEQVHIAGIHKVKMIWENQQHLNLKQLEDLNIKNCENLKEIVSKEEEEDGGPTFVFPKLTDLYLEGLPELERFYGGGADISDWPSLGELDVRCCDKLIDPSNLNTQKLFAKIITTPSLETCNLQGTNVRVRYKSLSGKLKLDGDIQKIGCSSVFPIAALFEIFQELKEVHIARFCFEQLFPCEPDVGDDHDIDTQAIAKTLARTKHLYLSHLSEMKHIWSEQYADDQFDGIPLNLQILEVESCGSLMSLAPKSALFQNMTRLVVKGCNELIKLVASSTTAKSLVNLTEMRVSECDSLKEIVAIYDDHDGEEASNNTTEDIVFGKLKTVVLKSLKSLTSFTTNNCNFQFPSLEQVTVAECPNMEFFSRAALSTPKLSGVWIAEERKVWKSDLNSTVRQLYKAMNSTEEYTSYVYISTLCRSE